MTTPEPNPQDRRRMRNLTDRSRDVSEDMDPFHPIGSPEDLTTEFARNQAELNEIMVNTFTAIDGRLEAMASDIGEINERQKAMTEGIDQRPAKMDERFDKIDLHLGYLRGAHASNVVQRNASLIADDMGYLVVTQLPREELIAFANMARAAGKTENDVRSFREADLVMLVRDSNGEPAYIAVEASFTVASKDVNRAKRNAEYLEEFTGLPALGVVAGVDIATGREQNAKSVGVHCYHIPVKDLEAD